MSYHDTIKAAADADKAFFVEAFTNPVTKEPYKVPADIREAAEHITRSYGIRGICDPMYIANVIAMHLGRGDGKSQFYG